MSFQRYRLFYFKNQQVVIDLLEHYNWFGSRDPQDWTELISKNYRVDRNKPLGYVKASTRIEHGDWKTQLVRKEFMGLKENEVGTIEGIMFNFEGIWFEIKRKDGRVTDVRCETLIWITKEEYEEAVSQST